MKNYTYLTAGNEDVQNVCKQMSNQNKTYMYEFDYRQKELFYKNQINNCSFWHLLISTEKLVHICLDKHKQIKANKKLQN